MSDVRTLQLSDIRLDKTLQMRAEIDTNHRDELAAAIERGETLDPVVVFDTGECYLLADGFHRFFACQQADDVTTIEAEVRKGYYQDALKYALGANARHGLKRSSEDKRKAIDAALDDEELGQMPMRQIAELVGVSLQLVHDRKHERAGNKPEPGPHGGARPRSVQNQESNNGDVDTSDSTPANNDTEPGQDTTQEPQTAQKGNKPNKPKDRTGPTKLKAIMEVIYTPDPDEMVGDTLQQWAEEDQVHWNNEPQELMKIEAESLSVRVEPC